MEFINGLHQDSTPEKQPLGTYRWALNFLVSDTEEVLTTEYSASKINVLDKTGYSCLGVIPMVGRLILFYTNGTNHEIGIYSETTGIYTPVLNNTIVATDLQGTLGTAVTNLNFNTGEEVTGIARFNNLGEIEVVFRDRINPPRIMYMPNTDVDTTTNVQKKYYINYDINQLNLFQTVSNTNITYTLTSAGNIPIDTYIISYRYKNNDGSGTSYYVLDKPLFVGLFGSSGNYNTKTNTELYASSGKSIQLTLTTIDDSFPFIEIDIYKVSTNELISLGEFSIKDNNILISDFSNYTTVSGGSTNLLATIYNYDRVQTVENFNNQLLLGNLKDSLDSDLPQQWVNTINITWNCQWIDVTATDLKDPNNVLKTFQAGEVYAFYIRGVKNGSYTMWKHIAGRTPITNTPIRKMTFDGGTVESSLTLGVGKNEKTAINTFINTDPIYPVLDNAKVIDPNSEFFRMFDTIPNDGSLFEDATASYNSGKMGYWENANELYEDVFSGNDLLIGNTTNKLNDNTNTKIRHHRFPSYSFLNTLINKYSTLKTSGYYVFHPASTTRYSELSKKFCSVVPQLGIKLDLSSIPDNIINGFDYFEIGYAKRNQSNGTVVGTDISLFGQYISSYYGFLERTVSGYNSHVQIPTEVYKTDAVLFTGGNFNNKVGRTLADGIGTKNVTNNGSYIRKTGTDYNEFIPERIHIHNPDLVDPVTFKNTSYGIDYVEHEVLMTTIELDTTGTESFASGVMTQNADAAGIIESFGLGGGNVDRDNSSFCEIHGFESSNWVTGYYGFYTADSYYNFDYTVTGNQTYDAPRTNKNFLANRKSVAISTAFYPDQYKIRPVTNQFYVAQNTGETVINGKTVLQGTIGYTGIRGSSNHLHICTQATGITQPTDFSEFSIAQGGTGNAATWVSNTFLNVESNISGSAGYMPSAFMSVAAYLGWADDARGGNPNEYAGDFRNNTFLTSLKRYRKNVYEGLEKQTVTKTEKTTLTAKVTQILSYGDMFISDVSYIAQGLTLPTIPNPIGGTGLYAGINVVNYRLVIPTFKNFNYRKSSIDTLTQFNNYYPVSPFKPTNKNNQTISTIFDYATVFHSNKPQALNLDSAFNTQNEIYSQSSIFTNRTIYTTTFPYRILQSATQANESAVNNWRVFPATSYYEIDKLKGAIIKLQTYEDVLLIHTENTLLETRGISHLNLDNSVAVIGTGAIFDNPPRDVMFNNLGYIGLAQQKAAMLCKLGYCFADPRRGKVFVYVRGNNPIEISDMGMYKFFRDYMNTSGETDLTANGGLSKLRIAYDNRFNRLLLTCNNTNIITGSKPFTISFVGQSGINKNAKWVSFHSYTPKILVNTPANLYGFIDNTTDGKAYTYLHNNKNSVNIFYDALNASIKYPSIIDLLFNVGLVVDKLGNAKYGNQDAYKFFQAFEWKTTSYTLNPNPNVEDQLNEDVTFATAQVFTEKQLSSEVTLLTPVSANGTSLVSNFNIRKFQDSWRFNNFRDNLIRNTTTGASQPVFIGNANTGYLLNNPQLDATVWNRRFNDRFIILRLTNNVTNSENYLIHLHNADAHFKAITK